MSNPSAYKGLPIPVVSSDDGAWGGELNSTIIGFDSLLGGTITFSASGGSVTLTTSEAYNLNYQITGSSTSTFTLTFPSSTAGGGIYTIGNNTTGSTTVTVTQSSSSATALTIPSGGNSLIVGNGTTFTFADNAHFEPSSVNFNLSGGGSVLSSGVYGYLEMGFNATITQAELLASPSGSITVDIWKSSFSAFPPSSANSITGSSTPTITSGVSMQNNTLTGWTTALNNGDILAFVVDGTATNISQCVVVLSVDKS